MSPIYINNKKIESIYTNNQSIGKVYVGDVLVFQKNSYTGKPFIFTIDTNLGTGASMTLPLRSGYNYNMIVDWGDGTSSTVTSSSDSNRIHNYATHGTYQISISGTCQAWYFVSGGDRKKLTTINQWGYTGFINMGFAFYECTNLTSINDVDGTWCDNVAYMNCMFRNCSSLQTLDVSTWNVSNVTNMYAMFNQCLSLQTLDVSNWDVSNVASMRGMFYGCPLTTASYNVLLIRWSQLPSLKPNVEFLANLAKYSAGAAATAREILRSAPNNWIIEDGGQVV